MATRYGFIVQFTVEAENEDIAEKRLNELLSHQPIDFMEFSSEIEDGPNELDEDNE